ncbi:MAG: RagB/SusD family nutrient uptake outer membrane protein [Clostridium sp.]|nr:RagB/SusD family nutrient uptake outer membrane protein [Prevotella sp.]MCM1378121.1 RagB/SusD family nutrient uptake outer membrane protein [Prevotella sp.]MCM1428945.1 RagB/SusD family nutrient uptake outer membrane protein [Clostridium sp.]
MKKNIFIKGAMSLLAAGMLASCSSDYLDRAPISTPTDAKMTETVENCQRAVWGACRSMYSAYQVGSTVQFMNGEAWINTMYGEVYGSDAFYYLWADMGVEFMRGDYLRVRNYWMAQMPWMYSYNLINQVNKVIPNIDAASGDDNERAFVKAQALTIRAHAYTKLIQLYAPRWEDSENGEAVVCPLMLESTTTGQNIATMNQILNQIYTDLNTAIECYKKSGLARRYGFEPDIEVAQGIYARIAMVKHDWATAQQMAHDARQLYPIMSGDQYLEGFCNANQEWMWYNENISEDEETGTFSWGASYACNGAYPARWGYGAGNINYDLYKKMDAKDIRRQLYWTPDKLSLPLRPNYFWVKTYVDELNMNMNKNGNVGNVLKAFSNTRPQMANLAYFENLPYRIGTDTETELVGNVGFGAQFKFWGAGPFSNTSFPFMRAAEMAFIEAEAAYMQTQESVAQNILEEVNGKRVDGYKCTKTGKDLLEEIQTSKRLELWGEGFCWTDLKRWRLPMIRRAWKAGDQNSGNFPATQACEVQPEALNGWRLIIPNAEADYNDLVKKYQQ